MFDIPMNTKGAMSLSEQAQQNFGTSNSNLNLIQPQQEQQSFNATPQYSNQSQPNTVNNQQPISKQRPQSNGVHLKKGQKAPLSANGQVLTNIQVCLGWDVSSIELDLDASAFMLGQNGKVIGDDWFVFYGQKDSPDGSLHHSGDSLDGKSVGDDEIIDIDLTRINSQVCKITFVVTINEALEKSLNFGMVSNAYARIVNKTTGQEIYKFNLSEYYNTVTSMVIGEVYKHNGQWKFNAVGDGVAKDLYGLCAMYGVNVVD